MDDGSVRSHVMKVGRNWVLVSLRGGRWSTVQKHLCQTLPKEKRNCFLLVRTIHVVWGLFATTANVDRNNTVCFVAIKMEGAFSRFP